MDATTGALIGVSATLGVLILLSVLRIVYLGFGPAYEAGPMTKNIFNFNLLNWFRILYYFLPYGLFLFGIIYDGLIRKIKFFPAGFVGLINVYLNSLISYGISKTSSEDSDVCGIPGMSKWGSSIAPQNIVFTTTILSYIASYITASQSDSTYSGAAWGGVGIVFLIQLGMYYNNECYSSKPSGGWLFSFLGSITPPLYALFGGLLVGGLAGYGFSNLQGDSSGVGLESEQKQVLTSGKGPAMAPTSGTPGAGKCSSTSNDDQFVCEAYKNGELVTSTIVE